MIEFEKAMDGVVRFLDKELFPGMADWQELIARAAMGRLFNNRAALKESLKNNGIARAFGVIDADGMIPADELLDSIKAEMAKKGKITVSVPMFGKMTFMPGDVDKLKAELYGGVHNDQAY